MPPPEIAAISAPRFWTSRSPVSKSNASAASSALYSPRLWPATKSGTGAPSAMWRM